MREVSIAYIDAADRARDMLLCLGILMQGLGLVCENYESPSGLKEALYLLSRSCDGASDDMARAKAEGLQPAKT